VLLSACSGWQSALDPRGPEAQKLADLFWVFFGVSVVVWLLVTAALVWAIVRRRPQRPDPLASDEARERRIGRVIAGCVAATGAVVIALTILSYFAQQGLSATLGNALTISVAGHQWWWEVRYDDPEPGRVFLTANEIHVPIGQPVVVKLETRDVIHSFWIPSLAGKMDQINNHPNALQFTASRAGVYRGQCAEFCGQQHAKMAFFVVASPPEEFAAWRRKQIEPATSPRDPLRAAGLHVFLSRSCMACHTIRGTTAGGQAGPDLTHLASRRSIAAGTLPLTSGHLAAWIVDPQHVKPGAQMPSTPLSGAELNALVAYLMGLE
jgi:cytochrome c oxidase subunit 2